MSEVRKRGADSSDSGRPAEGPQEAGGEHVSRRAFLQKAAGVGGFTVLGLMGAEAVLPAVLGRLEVLARNEGLAREVAAALRGSAIASGEASVDACPPGDFSHWCDLSPVSCSTASYDDCPGTVKHTCIYFSCDQPFNCDASTFACGSAIPGPQYACNADGFGCSADFYCSALVHCGPGPDPYSCPGSYYPPGC